MECQNHVGAPASGRCVACGQPFCSVCLVEVGGQSYCAGCKTKALGSPAVAVAERGDIPCREADEALKYALIGIVCFGIVLEPYALSLALRARSFIAANPRYAGSSGKATAALVISIVMLVLWVFFVLERVAETLSNPGGL